MSININGSLVSYETSRPPEPRVQVKIINPKNAKFITTHMLIDTGAVTSVMPADTISTLGFDFTTLRKIERQTAGGIKTAFLADVDIEINGETVSIEMDFALDWSVPVIGYNVFKDCNLKVNYPNGTFELTSV